MIRAAAHHQPIVFLASDLERATDDSVARLIDGLARDAVQIPLLACFCVDASAVRLDAVTALAFVHRQLVATGNLVKRRYVEPLSVQDIRSALGEGSPGLAERLHEISRGRPRDLDIIWNDWTRVGYVAHGAAGWRSVASKENAARMSTQQVVVKRVDECADPLMAHRLTEALRCGALEGRRFTAQAVAAVEGWDTGDLTMWFDAAALVTDARPHGLLRKTSGVEAREGEPSSQLSMYEFASEDYYRAFYAPTGERDRVQRLAGALESIYTNHPAVVAAALSRLYERLGRRAEAFQQRAIAGGPGDIAPIESLSGLLMQADRSDWVPEEYLFTVTTLLAGARRILTKDVQRAIELYEHALTVATEASLRPLAVESLLGIAQGQLFQGRFAECARTALKVIESGSSTPPLSAELAEAHLLLARVGQSSSVLTTEQAVAAVRSAIALAAAPENWRQRAAAFLVLSEIVDTANLDVASRAARESYTLFNQKGAGQAAAVAASALAELEWRQGMYQLAWMTGNRALTLSRAVEDRLNEGRTMRVLAPIARDRLDWTSARSLYRGALALQQELGDDGDASLTFDSLSIVAERYADKGLAARLAAIRYLILAEAGARAAPHARARMLALLGDITDSDEDAFVETVRQGYADHKGWPWVQEALAAMPA